MKYITRVNIPSSNTVPLGQPVRMLALSSLLSENAILKATFVFLLLCSALFSSRVSLAGSQIMVTPTRIIFDEKTRTQNVTVINSGDETGTYRILIVNKRMLPDGNIVDAKSAEPGEQFAENMIRYSPRQVTLKAGQSQIVRLSLRKPRDLKDGEYRSHISFKAMPKNSGVDINKVVNKNSQDISVKLTAIVSVTIPVIVRHGKTDLAVTIDSLKLTPPSKETPNPMVSLELTREGSRSVYGDFVAELVSNGKKTIVGRMNGVAVYTPNKARTVKFPLTVPEGIKLDGTLNVYFRTPAKRGSDILAKSLIKVTQ